MKYFGTFPSGAFDHMSPIGNDFMDVDIFVAGRAFPVKATLVGVFNGQGPELVVAPDFPPDEVEESPLGGWVLEFDRGYFWVLGFDGADPIYVGDANDTATITGDAAFSGQLTFKLYCSGTAVDTSTQLDTRRDVLGVQSSIDALAVRPEPYQILGYCDLQQGRPDAAVAAMAKASAQEPQKWEYHLGLAIAQASAGSSSTHAGAFGSWLMAALPE